MQHVVMSGEPGRRLMHVKDGTKVYTGRWLTCEGRMLMGRLGGLGATALSTAEGGQADSGTRDPRHRRSRHCGWEDMSRVDLCKAVAVLDMHVIAWKWGMHRRRRRRQQQAHSTCPHQLAHKAISSKPVRHDGAASDAVQSRDRQARPGQGRAASSQRGDRAAMAGDVLCKQGCRAPVQRAWYCLRTKDDPTLHRHSGLLR